MTPLVLGQYQLDLDEKTRVMGIVNATPDSFFDQGTHFKAGDSSPTVARALQLVEEGADIIDVGGETAQPTSPVLSPQEEIDRVVPAIEALAKHLTVPISVDTYKPQVAEAAIAAGASLINDTSGLADKGLAEVAAKTGAGILCMHIPCHPKERINPGYTDPVSAIGEFLREKAEIIMQAGVPKNRILVDPGIGFGKTPEENLELIKNTRQLRKLGFAVLFACSRRTFLGNLMGGLPPEDRLEPTVAVNAAAVLGGAQIIRVHDVKFMSRMLRMLDMVQPPKER